MSHGSTLDHHMTPPVPRPRTHEGMYVEQAGQIQLKSEALNDNENIPPELPSSPPPPLPPKLHSPDVDYFQVSHPGSDRSREIVTSFMS